MNLLAYCQTARDSSFVRDLLKYVSDLTKKDSFSGVVLVAAHDKILYHGAFGHASKEYDIVNAFSTRFDLASLSKTFTGIAIGQLAEQGKLNFTDPVCHYENKFLICSLSTFATLRRAGRMTAKV